MGLFNLFKKEKTFVEAAAAPVQQQPISLEKSNDNLGKVLIDLSKDSKVDLSKHTARVALALDYSGSMDDMYESGSVQDTITRLLPIALQFDDNKELEFWLFSNSFKRLDVVTKENYRDYVKKIINRCGMSMGGTNYSPCLKSIADFYHRREPSSIPAFVMFITDGECFSSDRDATDEIIRELSAYNMFVQFVGIGNSTFSYLKDLDNLSGRKHDNTGFITVKDMDKLSDQDLYVNLLKQYKAWLGGKQ